MYIQHDRKRCVIIFKNNLRFIIAEYELKNNNNTSSFMSKKELSKVTGLSRNAINRLLTADGINDIKLSSLISFCDTFNCKLSDLVDYIPDSLCDNI